MSHLEIQSGKGLKKQKAWLWLGDIWLVPPNFRCVYAKQKFIFYDVPCLGKSGRVAYGIKELNITFIGLFPPLLLSTYRSADFFARKL